MLIYRFGHLVVVICSFAAAEARADELQTKVLHAIRASQPDAYSFQRTLAFERTGSARKVLMERYDPRRPMNQRWSLVSVDGHPPRSKEVEQSQKSRKGPTPSYHELAEWFGAPAVRSDAAPGYVTYHFSRLPAGVMKIGSHDASADTQADALVNIKVKIPFVERVRFTSAKGFRMMMVASVQSIDFSARYTQFANGAVVPATSASTIKGSMFGKSGQMTTSVTFASFEAAR
ncbi:MAG: hypothetical protein EOP14_01140 [Pseudomonas sp.]|nr:MAG: hypothetical protein EOP14_01140 [Pseudomonas sp.]